MADRSDIDEVRRRTDLVSVVEKYVTLKRAGKGLTGLCPFHKEKTPSFHVNPDLGLWKCFGQCNEGGDVFKFVQKIENLSFPETLERLALRAGVTLTPRGGPRSGTSSPSERPPGDDREQLYRINTLALRFYREVLAKSPLALEYLQERGIAHAAAEDFALGFAPDSWDALTGYLARHGVALADAERAGLVSVSKNDGGYFDKLRGRLIFPIFDVQDRPVAFGGRLLGAAGPGAPKYWNSPETPLFSKSRTLYGLGRARKAIAAGGRAVVVEGYTDVVAAHQAGFENVVATLGTSLTEEHVKVLARLAPVVLLAFDADSAGLKAAFRAGEIFEAQDVEVRVLDLPEGEDPDSLLRAGRRLDFERAMDAAMPLTQYRLERLIRRSDLSGEVGRIALFKKALPVLATVPSVIEREQYVKRLAPYHPQYGAGAVYAEEHIRQDVAAYQSGRMGSASAGPAWTPPPAPLPTPPRAAAAQAERQLLLALAGDDPAPAEVVLNSLRPDEFVTETGRALASCLYAAYAADFEPDLRAVLADVEVEDPALANALTDLLMDGSEVPLSVSLVEDYIAHLKKRGASLSMAKLGAKVRQGQATPDEVRSFMQGQKELKGTPAPLSGG